MILKDINDTELNEGDVIVCVAVSNDFNVEDAINKLEERFTVRGGHLLSSSSRMAYYILGCGNEKAFRLDKGAAKRFVKIPN